MELQVLLMLLLFNTVLLRLCHEITVGQSYYIRDESGVNHGVFVATTNLADVSRFYKSG